MSFIGHYTSIACSFDTPGLAWGIAVSGSYAYLADGEDSGLLIMDISGPCPTDIIGSLNMVESTSDVAVAGSYAYLLERGLRIINVSNPSAPVQVGFVNFPEPAANAIAVSGSYAYIADCLSGLQIVNVSNPSSPHIVGSVATSDWADDVAVSGSYAYVAAEQAGLLIVDISTPSSPHIVNIVDTPYYAVAITISGSYAYVADVTVSNSTSIEIIDISSPLSAHIVGSVMISGSGYDVTVDGSYAYVASGYAGLQVVDISIPSAPYLTGSVDTPDWAEAVAISGSYAYVADQLSGLQIIDPCGATPPAIWDKTFGGSNTDIAESVQQTADGGYIIAGLTSSYGAGVSDAWLIKTDASGNELWNKTFGGLDYDLAQCVRSTTDGGYIIVGVTRSYGLGLMDVWLIKTDANGNKLWDKTFGGSNQDGALDVQEIAGGGYIISGFTSSYGVGNQDAWLIKTDENGNKLWDETFGGPYDDSAGSVQQTTDGGYIMGGVTSSYESASDAWLIKTDANGNKLWDKTFGGWNLDNAISVQQTTDGGYILAGGSWSYGAGMGDAWLIKTDANGNKLWDKTFGGSGYDQAYSVQQTTDGGYILAGGTSSYGMEGGNAWLIRTDASGNKLWDKTFGGSSGDGAYTVRQTADGGYIIAGETDPYGSGLDVWLIKAFAPEVGLVLIPDVATVSRGGTLGYTVTVTNNSASSKTFKYWTNVNLPNGSKYPPLGALFGPVTVTLGPSASRSVHLTHKIPGMAPFGVYTYNAYIGTNPETIIDVDHFDFQVAP